MQQGKEASVTLSGTSHRLWRVVIPLLYNGSCRIGLLTCGLDTFLAIARNYSTTVRPFNSEVHSVSALLPCLHHYGRWRPHLLGSLKIALKRTRPRQRFWYVVGRDCMTEGRGCQEENYPPTLWYAISMKGFAASKSSMFFIESSKSPVP